MSDVQNTLRMDVLRRNENEYICVSKRCRYVCMGKKTSCLYRKLQMSKLQAQTIHTYACMNLCLYTVVRALNARTCLLA